jgi:CarD family transcriptional regulator
MFNVGDNAVYPGHGVGIIKGKLKKNISGRTMEFYEMQILDNNCNKPIRIMIPVEKAEERLRSISPKAKVKKVYTILKDRNVRLDRQTWNRRYREYNEKIRTGELDEIAEVLRDLFLLKNTKELSFGERKMLDTARNLLVKEVSLSKKVPETKVENEIKAIFA